MFISKKKLNEEYVKRSDYEALMASNHYFEIAPGDTVYYLVFKDSNGKFCKEKDAEYVIVKNIVVSEENFFKIYHKLYSTVFIDYADALDYVSTFYG